MGLDDHDFVMFKDRLKGIERAVESLTETMKRHTGATERASIAAVQQAKAMERIAEQLDLLNTLIALAQVKQEQK